MELKGKVINFLGDSITEGYAATEPCKRFTDLIAAQYGAVCNNYGIGGTRIARQRTPSADPKWDLCFCDRAGEMARDADVIFVFGGTNDYGHGDAPIGRMEDRTPETFYGALHTLFAGLLTDYPDAEIVVATPLHRFHEEELHGDPALGNCAPLKTYVEIIREVAEYYALPVLDFYRSSGIQPELPAVYQRWTADGLHLNDAGHALLARRIASFLKTL